LESELDLFFITITGIMLSTHILLLSVLLIANIERVQNSRILGLFPHPGLSHFKFFQPIMKGLANAGHQVVVVSYFPDNNGSQKNYVDLVLPQSEEILTNTIDLEVRKNKTQQI
jgi:glucuronosyltransferase